MIFFIICSKYYDRKWEFCQIFIPFEFLIIKINRWVFKDIIEFEGLRYLKNGDKIKGQCFIELKFL